MQNPFIHIQNILSQCGEVAYETHGEAVSIEHLMLGFMRPKDSQMAELLEKAFGMNPDRLKSIIYSQLKHDAEKQETHWDIDTTPTPANKLQLDSTASEVMRNSVKEAFIYDHSPYVEPKHILLAILQQKNTRMGKILADAGITYDVLKKYLQTGLAGKEEPEKGNLSTNAPAHPMESEKNVDMADEADVTKDWDKDEEDNLFGEDGNLMVEDDPQQMGPVINDNNNDENDDTQDEYIDPDDEPLDLSGASNNATSNTNSQRTAKKTKSNTPAIDKYSFDLTQAAAEGKLDPVVGRDREIMRVMEILGRKKKNNPVLIGEPGVGKSAIVEGLAQLINNQESAPLLFNKRLVSLDVTAMVAGTKYRGMFEDRIKAVIKELEKNPNIIIFIDEIHTIIGAGGAEGAMDAANILKPALARGTIQCIGATTLDEYRKSIEKDGALERRFQKVIVDPTTTQQTLQILHNVKDTYERYHEVSYSEEALEACVKLSDRYISDRYFPDKAIDILDEVGSRVHLKNATIPDEILELEKQLGNIMEKKQKAVSCQNYEMAAAYRDKQAEVEKQLENARNGWQTNESGQRIPVSAEDIAHVVSQMTGIDVSKMAQSDMDRLKNMGSRLKAEVIAQDEAVDKLVKTIQRNRLGLRDPNHPIGVFMFLGPTGVGKTYLAKKLAEEMFGDTDSLIRIDMSEFSEGFNASRLLGAPPGYVGYDEGGQLTEKVRRKPYSIVLLDEIEKANGKIFNMLLQLLDEGRLTDGSGRLIDFRNTVIIMTSNAGTRQLKEFGRGIGFGAGKMGSSAEMSEGDKEYARSVIQKSLSKQFAPEFLNRFDEIITFEQLDINAIKRIVDLELKGLAHRIEAMGYTLQITDKAKEFVAKKGYDVQFGARPLKRAIQTYIEDGVCEMLLQGKYHSGDTISVGKCPGKEELTFK